MIEQTRFLNTVSLWSEFKLKNIYSGINFCGENVCVKCICGNVFLRIAGKTAKIRTHQNFVSYGRSFQLAVCNFLWQLE